MATFFSIRRPVIPCENVAPPDLRAPRYRHRRPASTQPTTCSSGSTTAIAPCSRGCRCSLNCGRHQQRPLEPAVVRLIRMAPLNLAAHPRRAQPGGTSLVAKETPGPRSDERGVVVFRAKPADRVTIVWDGSGLVMYWKRLETFAIRPTVGMLGFKSGGGCRCLGNSAFRRFQPR
jgi:hypothetical protein